MGSGGRIYRGRRPEGKAGGFEHWMYNYACGLPRVAIDS